MKGVYELFVQASFSAAHSLRGYQGDCACIHGHNWIIKVYLQCHELNFLGIGVDFRDIKKHIKKVLKDLDHCNLNDLSFFKDVNPTSENIAAFIFKTLSLDLNQKNIKISKIKVLESPDAGAVYWEE